MLAVNIDTQDGLINSQTGIIRHTEFAQGSARKFSDEQAGLKAMKSSYLGRQNSWAPIEKCEAEISIKKRLALRPIKHTQFPLTFAWTSTVQKVQSLCLELGVIDFDLHKQRSFGPGQMYTAISRVKNYDNLFCILEFKKSAKEVNKDVNKDALLEYERLKENTFFPQ